MIYIDPPYNTGKDTFVYFDQFEMDKDEYNEGISRYDEMGIWIFLKIQKLMLVFILRGALWFIHAYFSQGIFLQMTVLSLSASITTK